MRLLAIDPGPAESAWLLFDTDTFLPLRWEKTRNAEVLGAFASGEALAVEALASYGMPVGVETFETAYAIGAFERRWLDIGGPEPIRVYRREVKLHICGDSRAKDSNMRQALIDRYGGSRKAAIGLKASPGPLYGMSGDCWSALAVAITAAERDATEPLIVEARRGGAQ